MALEFGKYRHNIFKSNKNVEWEVQIWKKDYADKEPDGTTTYYPSNASAREFASVAGFNQWNNAAGWAWSSSYGGSAKHTAGNNQNLIYDTDINLLENGVEYRVCISIQGMTTGNVRVKLGGASGPTLTNNQAYCFEVVAGGGDLQIDPSSQFDGYIQDIQIVKYFEASQPFNTSEEGFTIKWNGAGGTRDKRFLGSECVVNFLIENNADETFMQNSLTEGTNAYFIRIYKDNAADSGLWWFGWVQPAFDQIQNAPYPYVYKITATDSYGFYSKGDKKVFDSISSQISKHSIKDIFFDFLEDMKIIDLGTSGHNHSPAPEDDYILRTAFDWWMVGDYDVNVNKQRVHCALNAAVPPALRGDGADTHRVRCTRKMLRG